MNLKYYLNRMRQYPLHIIFYKILRKIARGLKGKAQSFRDMRLIFISDEELVESLDDSFKSINELVGHLRKRKSPRFFFDPAEKDNMVNLIKHHYPDSVDRTIADADKICEHVFDLLGSGPVSLGDKIDWHTDFKVNWTWKRKYYKLIDSLQLGKPCDVKVPWELSRFQHSVTLGKAYWYTKDEKYAAEFVSQVSDWIESNPTKFSVNWVCTMDVAIRAVNWIWGYYFFTDSPNLTDEFLTMFIKSLLAHGRHIADNLEGKGEVRGNHYLSDLVGLVYIGVLFPEFKEAEEWRKSGISELIREMERQVYTDGVNYEESIAYHRLVTELFLSPTLLVSLNGQADTPLPQCFKHATEFPDWYVHQLEKMIEFVLYYTKPDGTAPQIGDNDDGRLHILSNYGNKNWLDHTYLLSLGSALYGRTDFRTEAKTFHEESFWLLNSDGLNSFNSPETESARPGSKAFPLGGFYIMRHEDLYMIVDCAADNPRAPSGHKHNSRLSFELFAYGRSFIIDPGAYIYTADPQWRNIFRSTAYHNTIQVDGKEQNETDPLSLFALGRDAKVKINEWQVSGEYDFLDAEHRGYERLANPVTHRRQIFFNKQEGYWLIRDILLNYKEQESLQEHEFGLSLHFAPMKIATDQAIPMSLVAAKDGAGMIIIPIEPDGLGLSIGEEWISYSYGTKIAAPIIRYTRTAKIPTEFLTLFYPYADTQPEINIVEIQEAASSLMKGLVH